MTGPEPGQTPLLVLISRVWGVVGALALVVALVLRSPVVGVFGGLALLAAAAVFGVQAAQDRSVERNSRATGASAPPPPTRASDVMGGSRGTAREEPSPAPTGPDLRKGDGGSTGGATSGGTADDGSAPVDPASSRPTGPRRRPEPSVPSTARNRGRRNPTAGRDTGPLPTQSAQATEETDDTEDPDDTAPTGRIPHTTRGSADDTVADGDVEDDVVDEPTQRREPEDSEIDDAETVDDPGHR